MRSARSRAAPGEVHERLFKRLTKCRRIDLLNFFLSYQLHNGPRSNIINTIDSR